MVYMVYDLTMILAESIWLIVSWTYTVRYDDGCHNIRSKSMYRLSRFKFTIHEEFISLSQGNTDNYR